MILKAANWIKFALEEKTEEYMKIKKIQTNSKGKDENQIINFFNEEEDLKEFFFIKAGHNIVTN